MAAAEVASDAATGPKLPLGADGLAADAAVLLCGTSDSDAGTLGVPADRDNVTRVEATVAAVDALGSDKKFDIILAVCRDAELFSHRALLPKLAAVLKPGGTYSHVESASTGRDAGAVNMELTFAGLLPPQATAAVGDLGVAFNAQAPSYEVGAVAQLRRRPKKKPAAAAAAAAAPATDAAKVWTVMAADTALVDETALADEDDLLAEDIVEVNPAAAAAAAGGCATKRRACKNCSCGRKEMEEAAEKDAAAAAALAAAPAGGCGNCSKGDAFRCATCPYLGTPAFEPGSVVKLDLSVSDF